MEGSVAEQISKLGIKKKILAAGVGITPSSLSKFLAGTKGYDSPALARRIAAFLDQYPAPPTSAKRRRGDLSSQTSNQPPHMIKIAITNNKGGTGKTTVAHNLAAGLHRLNYSVLMVDLDPQANLSLIAGVPETDNHIARLLNKELPWENVVYDLPVEAHEKPLAILPAQQRLSAYEYLLKEKTNWQFLLRNVLKDKAYDFVVMDCPPNLGFYTANALTCADYYVVPMQGETLVFVGLDKIIETCDEIRENINPALKLAGVLQVKFDKQTTIGKVIANKTREYGYPVFKTGIRKDVSVVESQHVRMSLFAYNPDSRACQDMTQVVDEFLTICGINQAA